MKRIITLVNLATGELGSVLTLPDESAVVRNVREGFGCVEGRFDRVSQRFDFDANAVVDRQPPQPSDDHEWKAEDPAAASRVDQRWRWTVKREVLVQRERMRRGESSSRIDALESQVAELRGIIAAGRADTSER